MNELELRCLKFATDVRDFCRILKHDTINTVYIKQLVRSSSSIGANYIEANEKLGKQDLLMRLRIARKEAKETQYWLELVIVDQDLKRNALKQEAEELRRILSAIINKVQ
ncbi:MAG: four helix bundle protein [Flavipsychrobacter sp.]|nr:four helix bundle protein [Flavipsychrobacter sp.]